MTLKEGASGADVTRLQQLLTAAGFPCDADGSFGPQTDGMLRMFQRAHGLVVDGIAGPVTMALLDPSTPKPTPAPARFLRGIDVSYAQGTVNWDAVKASGIDFAFMKATEGLTLVDSRFKQNWTGAKAAGVIRAPYHFYQIAKRRPADQAAHFMNTVQPLLEKGDMTCAMDLELETTKQVVSSGGTYYFDGVTASDMNADARTFLNAVTTATQKTSALYSGLQILVPMRPAAEFANNPLWDANWDVSQPKLAAPWTAWTWWQYRVGTCPGIAGAVDLDYFNGMLTDLQKFLR